MQEKQIRQILKNYGLQPNKLLGQNFLIDEGALAKIIQAAALTKSDAVLEVGPGLGILTEKLAKYAGRVVAVEKDKRLAEVLQKKFKDAQNVQIIQGDILKFSIFKFQVSKKSQIQNLKSKIQNYKVVANIPYYLTSHLIRQFLESANPPRLMVLMLQKEVARRICANPPKMSLLAVAVQFYAKPEIIADVTAASFWPKPKVDSAIVRITPYSSPLYKRGVGGDFKIPPHLPLRKGGVENFFHILKAGFSQPRKKLLTNLSRGLKIDPDIIAEVFQKYDFEATTRAQNLSVRDWKNLAKTLEPWL